MTNEPSRHPRIRFGCYFCLVFLAVELSFNFMRRYRRGSNAVNKRMQMIEGGMDRQLVTSQLRKSQTGHFAHWPGIFGRIANGIEKTVIASGVAMPAQQIMLLMLLVSAGSALVTIIGAAYAGYSLTLGLAQLALMLACVLALLSRCLSIENGGAPDQENAGAVSGRVGYFCAGPQIGPSCFIGTGFAHQEMEDPLAANLGWSLTKWPMVPICAMRCKPWQTAGAWKISKCLLCRCQSRMKPEEILPRF